MLADSIFTNKKQGRWWTFTPVDCVHDITGCQTRNGRTHSFFLFFHNTFQSLILTNWTTKCLDFFFFFFPPHFLLAWPAVPVCLGSPLNYQSQTPKKTFQTIFFIQCNREIIYFIILRSQSNFPWSACTTVPLTANPLLEVNGLSVSRGCWTYV